MRIGIGITAMNNPDGIGVYTNQLIKGLTHFNQEVMPINFANKPEMAHTHVAYKIALLGSMLTYGVLHSKQLQNKKIELFHATDYAIPRLKKIPVVATLHDAIKLKHPEWCSNRLRWLTNWYLKKSVRWASRVIAISHAIIPDLVEYWGVPEEMIDVVYHGLDAEWFQVASAEKKAALLKQLNLSQPFMLFVGTLQPRKNIERLLAAYAALPSAIKQEYQLVIVGKNGWRTDALLNSMQKLMQAGTLKWFPNLRTEDLRVLYQTATLFLYPSLSEGFGLPILEAFASKLPVITSNVTSMPEIAGDAAILVNPFVQDELCEAMQDLAENAGKRQALIEKGYARAQSFTWQRCIEQTVQVYQKTI